jgi:hypothetical protein
MFRPCLLVPQLFDATHALSDQHLGVVGVTRL